MWCYISICRFLINSFPSVQSDFDSVFLSDQLFPYLQSGTKICVSDETCFVEVIYDNPLPKKSAGVRQHITPLYMTGQTGSHYRPDICINVYHQKSNWYIGTIIIECKYRKLTSFWEGNTWNSRNQVITYHNDSKSNIYYGGIGFFRTIRPVKNVLVFTPDVFSGREYPDNCVSLHKYKITEDRSFIKECGRQIIDLIRSYVNDAEEYYNLQFPVRDL